MSDEFAKTQVLDDLPFARTPGSPATSKPNVNIAPSDTTQKQDINPAVDYPGFEDTSWLT